MGHILVSDKKDGQTDTYNRMVRLDPGALSFNIHKNTVEKLERMVLNALFKHGETMLQHIHQEDHSTLAPVTISLDRDRWHWTRPVQIHPEKLQTLEDQLTQAAEKQYPRARWDHFIRRPRTWAYIMLGAALSLLGLSLGSILTQAPSLLVNTTWGIVPIIGVLGFVQWEIYSHQQQRSRRLAQLFIQRFLEEVTYTLDDLNAESTLFADRQPPEEPEEQTQQSVTTTRAWNQLINTLFQQST